MQTTVMRMGLLLTVFGIGASLAPSALAAGSCSVYDHGVIWAPQGTRSIYFGATWGRGCEGHWFSLTQASAIHGGLDFDVCFHFWHGGSPLCHNGWFGIEQGYVPAHAAYAEITLKVGVAGQYVFQIR